MKKFFYKVLDIVFILFVMLLIISILLHFFKDKLLDLKDTLGIEYYVSEDFDNPLEAKEDRIDKLYCKLYDQVFNEPNTYLTESKSIISFIEKHDVPKKKGTPNNLILEAGSGTGKHYQHLATVSGYKVIGIDRSKTMEDIFKIKNPLGKFVFGDMRNENLFKAETFSYIVCLKETLYHNSIKDWDLILSNFYYWLKPEGYLIINVYDREKLDPAPRNMSMLRFDGNKRKHSITNFPNFTHDGWWEVKGNTICQYNEIYAIRGKNNEIEKKRHYKHNMVIPAKDKIMEKIVGNYFKLIDVKKFIEIGLTDHELCFFKKNKF